MLWRAAMHYPEHPHAALWQERAHEFLINGVSIEADALDERIIAGKPLRERHIGANFFSHYALDHHGYLNVGYMVICVSNVAMLHFDMKAAGLPCPESLYLHQVELWNVLRRFIFSDGRLARIGGDGRIRYAYCQEYLLPALLFAADYLKDPHALPLIERQLGLIQGETSQNNDGSFYSSRLDALRRRNPLYYTRLESDRACALAMLVSYRELVTTEGHGAEEDFETTVADSWCEPEHGAVFHRCPTRLASFCWRAMNLAQGMCQPPGDGHLAEWEYNLGGRVEFCHHSLRDSAQPQRRLNSCNISSFEGGFITCGSLIEGADLVLAESWSGSDSALLQTAFAALPDGHTVIGMHFCQMGARRGYVASIKGLHLNIPNDVYQQYRRRLECGDGEIVLESPPAHEQALSLHGHWANIEGKLGVVGLYGDRELTIHRTPERRAGNLRSLYVEEICYPLVLGPACFEAGEVILDCGWAVLSSVSTQQTRAFHDANLQAQLDTGTAQVRAVEVSGLDGLRYWLVANFSRSELSLRSFDLRLPGDAVDLQNGQPATASMIEAGHARLFRAT